MAALCPDLCILGVFGHGWVHDASASLGGDPTAVPSARRHVRAALAGWGVAADLAADVEVVVSELVSNSVREVQRHQAIETAILLRVLGSPQYLLVTVWDAAPGLPQLGEPSLSRPGGRGLQVVSGLSRGWGYLLCPDGGKTVYAVFEQHEQ